MHGGAVAERVLDTRDVAVLRSNDYLSVLPWSLLTLNTVACARHALTVRAGGRLGNRLSQGLPVWTHGGRDVEMVGGLLMRVRMLSSMTMR